VQRKDYGVDYYDGEYLYLIDVDDLIEENADGAKDNPADAQFEESPDDDTHQEKRIALPEENHLVKVVEKIENFNFEGFDKLRVRVQSFGGREQIIDACVLGEVCAGW